MRLSSRSQVLSIGLKRKYFYELTEILIPMKSAAVKLGGKHFYLTEQSLTALRLKNKKLCDYV